MTGAIPILEKTDGISPVSIDHSTHATRASGTIAVTQLSRMAEDPGERCSQAELHLASLRCVLGSTRVVDRAEVAPLGVPS